MSAMALPRATSLARHVSIALRDRAGDRIECVAGVLWITQDGDARDIVLGAGESFRLDRAGSAVLFALADARFVLRRRPERRWGSRLARAFAALRARLARPARSFA
jgi:hypothetical protein